MDFDTHAQCNSFCPRNCESEQLHEINMYIVKRTVKNCEKFTGVECPAVDVCLKLQQASSQRFPRCCLASVKMFVCKKSQHVHNFKTCNTFFDTQRDKKQRKTHKQTVNTCQLDATTQTTEQRVNFQARGSRRDCALEGKRVIQEQLWGLERCYFRCVLSFDDARILFCCGSKVFAV